MTMALTPAHLRALFVIAILLATLFCADEAGAACEHACCLPRRAVSLPRRGLRLVEVLTAALGIAVAAPWPARLETGTPPTASAGAARTASLRI